MSTNSNCTTVGVLKKAREIVANPETWTRHTLARDRQGCSCPVDSDRACTFCAVGAVMHVSIKNGVDRNKSLTLLRRAAHDLFHEDVEDVNDKVYGQRNILRVFDEAIRSSETEGR